ncbi:MAG: glycosyltransferase family 4 protein [archaeon]
MPKKILFIHHEKKPKYGAHYINDLIVDKLRKAGYSVDTVYPQESIELFSKALAGIRSILFFYSLTSHKKKAHKYDIVQGTTYTTLPFLNNGTPVVSHFGSTTFGFLKNVPSAKTLEKEKKELAGIFSGLKKCLAISEREYSIRALQDISKMEIYVAKKSDAVIATSQKVLAELTRNGVPRSKIHVIHNAIEDYWFKARHSKKVKKVAELVYLGRMGNDVFTIKLKGINRLVFIFKKFPELKKKVIGMCQNFKGYLSVFSPIPNTKAFLSMEKKKIPNLLGNNYGDLYINPGRYEGFCLSLVEAMSQGLIPITFPVGIAPEIIKNGKNGYLVNSIDEMAGKIGQLKSNPKKRAAMAKNAMQTSNQFTADALITQLTGLYRQIKIKQAHS